MLDIVKELIEELKRNDVLYVHFKSNEHLNESVDGDTDFDILIDRMESQKYERCLLSLDFKRFNSSVHSSYPGVDDWLGFDFKTGKLVHLHTHYQLVTGKSGYKNFVLPWTSIALESAIIDTETSMKIVSAEFELVELYTRFIAKMAWEKDQITKIKGYQISDAALREVEWLWERVNKQELIVMCHKCFGNFADFINIELFYKKSLTAKEYLTFRKIVLNLLELHERSGMQGVSFRSSCYKSKTGIIRKLKKLAFLPAVKQKKVCHTGGLLIAFLGVDGSGKTTVTSEIHSWLSWKFESSHMGLGYGRRKQMISYKVKQKIKSLLNRGTKSKKTGSVAVNLDFEKPIKVTWKSYRKQRAMVRFAKQIRKDIIRIHSYCLNGGIMVVDRYPQLQFFGISDGRKVNQAFSRLQQKESAYLDIVNDIQPDIVFKLMVPVELSNERRPDDAIELLQKKLLILQSINYTKAKIFEVDATQPLEDELVFIKQKIWEML